jgi:hypothetical protein
MLRRPGKLRWIPLASTLLLGGLCCWGHAQTVRQIDSITGVVMDPSGAVVPGAAVTLMDAVEPSAVVSSTTSGPAGGYRFQVIAALTFDVRLRLETKVEQIEVPDAPTTGGNRDGSVIVLSARQVEEMPLDPTTLLDELRGLAGSSSAELYVDGFSGAKLPPRDSIQEVRINQGPYSAENDTDPVNGTIQVSSKAGTNQTHGQFYLYGDDSALNAGNPFSLDQPPYYADGTGGLLSGPLNHRTSYYGQWDQVRQEVDSAVDAQTLDASLNEAPAIYAVSSPRAMLDISPRVDFRAGANSTMTFRYIFDRSTQTNGGIGQLALASQGFDNRTVSQTLQIANTQVIGSKIVNESRFQFLRTRTTQTPLSTDATIVVQGSQSEGGSAQGVFDDHQDRYELQNYLSLAARRHYLKLGGRLRVGRDANHSEANYNGEFIFSTFSAYQMTRRGMAAGEDINQIRANGGGASQFNLTVGKPDAAVTIADAGLFVQDDWKARENLTLSFGLRFETQNYISDHADWAPRVGFSWGLRAKGKNGGQVAPRYVVHGGAGVFYRRFTTDSALQVERRNGVTQQQYVVESPQFCPTATGNPASVRTPMVCSGVPTSIAGLAAQAAAPTIYRVSPDFHAPYFVGATAGVDRHFGRTGTVGVTYLNNRGVHTQLTENVNAPLPGTYDPTNPTSGVRPNGSNQNVYEYVSEGVYRSNQLTANASARASRLYVFGSYVLRYDKSDAENNGSFPSNTYNLGGDYGRSLGDVRHAAGVGDSVELPFGFHSWSYLRATSGAPFNIVVGQDLNGDTQYNDRPAFATDLTRPSVIATKWGTFDTSPIAGQSIIPRNYGQGPGLFVVNLAMGKSFGVGPALDTSPSAGGAKQSASHKYTVDMWVEIQNLLNHPNLMPPVGTLTSPLFGHSIGLAGNSSLSQDRFVDLELSMHF